MTKVLSLDLDETLISSRWYPVDYREPDFMMFDKYAVYKRPHLEEFLTWAFDTFDKVGVSTTADKAYADVVVENIFGGRELAFLFTYRDTIKPIDAPSLYSYGQRTYIKDASKIRKATGVRTEHLVIVDDKISVYDHHTISYSNVVVVNPYHLDPEGELYPDELLSAKYQISTILSKW